jgi:HTH-type transcriptional regulator/antitoxin HipB
MRTQRSVFQELGDAIRRRRRELRLTQHEVAALASCAELFIRELEGGKSTVRLSKVVDVLRVLGLQFSLENGREGIHVRPAD